MLTRLSILSGNDSYRERADAIIRAFGGEVRRNFFPLSTLINNAELAQKPTQIVLVGAADAPELTELRRAVHTVSLPRRIVQVVAPGEALPAGHPAAGKGLVNGNWLSAETLRYRSRPPAQFRIQIALLMH